MKRATRQEFSPEFKREAVRLLEAGDKDAAQLARELGIRRNQLYKWKDLIERDGNSAFPGKGRKSVGHSLSQTAELEAEVKKLREENEILKKAAIFFARECD